MIVKDESKIKKNVIPSVAVLVINKDKVLLVKHGEGATHLTGVYGLPGGRFTDETEKEAAVREFEEETGLKTTSESLIEFPGNVFQAEIKRKDGIGKFLWKVFLCKKYLGDLKKSEETEPEWIEIEKLSNYNLLPNTINAVQNAVKSFNIKKK